MKRGSFLKSLATLFIAPSVISKIDIEQVVVPNAKPHISIGSINKMYVSAISYLDQREININIIDDNDFTKIMKSMHKYNSK